MHHTHSLFSSRSLISLSLLLFCLFLGGCQLPEQGAPPTTTLSYQLPSLTPIEPDKQDQEKDGIRISVAGYTYLPKLISRREYREAPAIFVANNQYPVIVRETPRVAVFPKEVRFKVKIYNRLERVLRMAGTAVQFQVAGKTVAVNKANYEEFLNGIVLPRQEAEYEISGPDTLSLPDNATIALFLYDIVTATDAAGNPTKRSNFEFFYALSRQPGNQEASITERQIMVGPSELNLLRQRTQGTYSWVSMPEFDRVLSGRQAQ